MSCADMMRLALLPTRSERAVPHYATLHCTAQHSTALHSEYERERETKKGLATTYPLSVSSEAASPQ